MSDGDYVNLSNTTGRPGSDTYQKVIAEIQKNKECPFCPEQLSKYHKNPIIFSGEHWIVTDNMYPYKNAAQHILFIHKTHLTSPGELSQESWVELHTIVTKITQEKNIKGGTLMMRFGDTRYTGASVTHLHAHIVSPHGEQENREPILARVG